MKVKALPKDMPDQIEVNISSLNIGQSVRVNQIQIPGVEFLNTPTGVIIGVQTTRVVVEETKAAPTAAAATPAAGATPAAAPAADKKAEKPAAKK